MSYAISIPDRLNGVYDWVCGLSCRVEQAMSRFRAKGFRQCPRRSKGIKEDALDEENVRP